MKLFFQKFWLLAFFTLLFGVFSFFISFPSLAGFYSVKAYDSIAGYGTEIKIGNTNPSEKIKVFILPPSGNLQTYLQNAKNDGTAAFILAPEKTKQAGIYKTVVVEPEQSYSDGIVNSFEIFPDDPETQNSFFYSIDDTIPTGIKGKITILLKDKYNNPVSGHRVSLTSSRSYEKFTSIGDPKTNEEGEASFLVQSNYNGDALITAKDETYGKTIKDPLTIRFYKNALSNSLKGDSTGMGTGENTVAKFSIDFPDSIPMNSDANYMSITALDASGKIVKDFTGSIFITIPTDPNATLPAEKGVYTFKEADQGRITFSRSLVFSSAGNHKIEVYSYNPISDETNFNIFGKKDVKVENKTVGTDDPNSTPITIESPSHNTILSSKSVIISGKALKNTDLQILIDKKIIKTIETDDNGNFSNTLFDLESGEHTLQIQQKNNPSILSSSVLFKVGEKGGEITSASLSKYSVQPKESVDIQVQIDPSITPKSVEASLNGISHSLQIVRNGLYQASFNAPSEIGEYTVTTSVQNSLGEIQEKIIPSKLIVQNNDGNLTSGSSVVSGITSEYIKEREVVQISWNPLTPEPLLYIIHSGSSPSNLKKVKSVSGTLKSTEIEMTSFKESYFAVSAVDINGKEGSVSSTSLLKTPATPMTTPTPTMTPTMTPTPTDSISPRKAEANPQENKIQISWNQIPSAYSYKVSYGFSSRVYQEEKNILAPQLETVLEDLIPQKKYFIKVEAVDKNGNILYEYPEIITTPVESSFHASAVGGPQSYPTWVPQTGPLSSLFLGSLFFGFSIYFFRKSST